MRLIRAFVWRATFAVTVLTALSVTATPAYAQSICNGGNQVVVTAIELTASCTVTGSLTIQGGMVRAIFPTGSTAVLRVEGDVSVSGTGVLWVGGGRFEIQQDHNQHRKISTTDDATIVLKDTTVSLNQGTGLKYLLYSAYDKSKMFVVGSALDQTRSWMISNHFEDSRLLAISSQHLPTEIYVKERSTVTIADPASDTGVWLDLPSGSSGTLDLPAQADAGDQRVPYSWRVGRNAGGVTGLGWLLEIANARVGLGLESHAGSSITVNGRGTPATGEAKIAYHVSTGSQTLTGLSTGLQGNKILGGDQLTLRNVELGPIAWQVYARDNATLTINSSVLNEVGVASGGHVTVNDSIIQFGAIASLESNAASVAIHNSQIHSQTIEASNDGVINIYDSAVFGAAVVTHEPASAVNFHRGALLRNSAGACPLILDSIVNIWGVPLCNPFLAPGTAVTKAGSGVVSCDSTFDCSW